jgi:hypothetical protein
MPGFPYFTQLDSMDCGPTCLQMVAKYYGKSYSLQYLRSRSYITKSGVSMLGISDAAESIGFRTRGYSLTWEQLRDEVPLPCIVHWNQRHFVVVYDIKRRASLKSRAGRASQESHASHASHASQESQESQESLAGRASHASHGMTQDLQDRTTARPARPHDQQNSKYQVFIADPAAGLLKYSQSEFLKCWYSTKNEGIQEGTALL